jgi:hypothetical protein
MARQVQLPGATYNRPQAPNANTGFLYVRMHMSLCSCSLHASRCEQRLRQVRHGRQFTCLCNCHLLMLPPLWLAVRLYLKDIAAIFHSL